MRFWAMLACAVVATVGFAAARAQTQVQVLETWPAGDNLTLDKNQTFYLHLHYTSDTPVRIWAHPQYQGQPARAGGNTSRLYPAGEGEAMAWFFLFDPGTQVDAIQLAAGDGRTQTTSVVTTYPVSMTGGNAPAAETPQPEWVSRLRGIDKAAQDADYRDTMNAATTPGAIALFNGFMLAMLAIGAVAFAGPTWGLWRWHGAWRMLAAVPAAAMAFVVLRIFIDTARDPTSHNLWPFEIVMWGAFSCAWMLVLGVAHRLLATRRS